MPVASVPARSLPAQTIQPIGRVDSSGTTALFTTYLSFSGAWTLGNRTLAAFPPCVTRAKGSAGMAAAVHDTPFAIGCARPGAGQALCTHVALFTVHLSLSGAWTLGNRTLAAFTSCMTRVKRSWAWRLLCRTCLIQLRPFAILRDWWHPGS